MMNIEFLPQALSELIGAAVYYEAKEIGLGKRFRADIEEVCRTVLSHPLLWRERKGGFRRVNCPVFPYYIAYFIRENKVVIAAVAHENRHPEYWKKRT